MTEGRKEAMSTEILEAACIYVDCGMSVIPIRRWSKRPDDRALGIPDTVTRTWAERDRPWRIYTERMPQRDELVRWFAATDCGVAIVGGKVSGGLVRLDFEHPSCLPTWYALLSDDAIVSAAARALPVVATMKGHHVYFRMVDPPGYEILCSGLSGDEQIVLAELQAEGCYCLAPPTPMYTDAGIEAQYAWTFGPAIIGPKAVPLLSTEIATKLIDAARFPGLWAPTFVDHWGDRAGALHRSGLTLRAGRGRDDESIWLGWQHLGELRSYLNRYALLLGAVEHAPPAPPSYSYAEEDLYYE
jgi:hypothetical protein